jgi:hypothetical protein
MQASHLLELAAQQVAGFALKHADGFVIDKADDAADEQRRDEGLQARDARRGGARERQRIGPAGGEPGPRAAECIRNYASRR